TIVARGRLQSDIGRRPIGQSEQHEPADESTRRTRGLDVTLAGHRTVRRCSSARLDTARLDTTHLDPVTVAKGDARAAAGELTADEVSGRWRGRGTRNEAGDDGRVAARGDRDDAALLVLLDDVVRGELVHVHPRHGDRAAFDTRTRWKGDPVGAFDD